MDSDKKGIWQIRLATLSIFVLGFIAGAFALHSYHLWFSATKQPTKQERYEEVFTRLGLSETQKADIRKIVGETRDRLQKLRQESDPRVQEIRAQHDENLQKILTPDQWQRFQQEREKIRQTEKTPTPPKPLNIQ